MRHIYFGQPSFNNQFLSNATLSAMQAGWGEIGRDILKALDTLLLIENQFRPESSRLSVNIFLLQAVWGETGRDVLKALDTLPEADVLLDEDDIMPPDSPKYHMALDAGEEKGRSEGEEAERTASSQPSDTIKGASGKCHRLGVNSLGLNSWHWLLGAANSVINAGKFRM